MYYNIKNQQNKAVQTNGWDSVCSYG